MCDFENFKEMNFVVIEKRATDGGGMAERGSRNSRGYSPGTSSPIEQADFTPPWNIICVIMVGL
jgi:hypothetical protein